MKLSHLLLLPAVLLAGCATMNPADEEEASAAQDERPSGRLPYGNKVADRDGFVTSPHSQNSALIDVRGFPRGAEVTDPWTGEKFLVP